MVTILGNKPDPESDPIWAEDKPGIVSSIGSKQPALGFTPENVANKASAFSATPANVKYPTEKLVKDNLDLKADLSGADFTGNISALNLSNTNTGDETSSSIKSKLGITTLSGSNTGDQDLSNYVTLDQFVPLEWGFMGLANDQSVSVGDIIKFEVYSSDSTITPDRVGAFEGKADMLYELTGKIRGNYEGRKGFVEIGFYNITDDTAIDFFKNGKLITVTNSPYVFDQNNLGSDGSFNFLFMPRKTKYYGFKVLKATDLSFILQLQTSLSVMLIGEKKK